MSTQEREQILATVVETTKNRVPVVAGTSSNSTAATIQLTQDAKAAGVDACMVMSPYYSLPSQRGLYEHFKAVAEVGLPVMLYNNPGRAGVTILPETVARLADVPGIVAVKEATGNVAQVRVSLDRLSTLGVADTFTRTWLGRQATEIAALCDLTIFGGEDTLALPLMSIGATGVMSVLSNAGRMHCSCVATICSMLLLTHMVVSLSCCCLSTRKSVGSHECFHAWRLRHSAENPPRKCTTTVIETK